MSLYKKVAIVGASGNVGSIILNGLIADPQFTVTVLSRSESKATFPGNVVVHKSDFSANDLEAAFQGQDAVISAVGASAFNEQKKLVDAAVRAGVKRFIPSEFSVSSQNEMVIHLLPLFGQKKELIEYLKTKELDGLSWTGIATSGLFDWGLANGFLEFNIARRTTKIWDGGHKIFTLTNEKQLSQAVVSVLKHPEETRNQFLHIASVETTQREILAALEKEIRSKWTLTETTTAAQIDEAHKKLGTGDFGGALILVRATCFGNTPGLRSNYAADEKLANDVLGLELESVGETVKRVMQSIKPE